MQSQTSLKGLKILFVNMPLRESARPNTPPEGPLILAAILRQRGAVPTLLDLNAYRIPDASRPNLPFGRHLSCAEAEALLSRHLARNGDQDIVAFSGMITTLRWQEDMARIVRRLQPQCFLVSGGGLATELGAGLFRWMPELDAVAHSEGEGIIAVLAQDTLIIKDIGRTRALRSGRLSASSLGELAGRERFFYGGGRPHNLDELPFGALDLLESDPDGRNLLEEVYIPAPVWGTAAGNSSAASFSMNRSLTTVSSRGCPHACSFCYRGAQGERNYRMRSAQHLAEQVGDLVHHYRLDFIGHPDDNFAIDRGRIESLPRVYKEMGIHVRWGTHARLDEADDRLLPMARSGCLYIGFGAESASAKVLERMKKGGFILKRGFTQTMVNGHEYHFPQTMVNGIENCRNARIHANCTWIMGYPGETLVDLQTSVAFILWQREAAVAHFTPGTNEYRTAWDSVNTRMFMATAYPGTEMFSDPEARQALTANFSLSFDASGQPVCDEALHSYILELDDATKVMRDRSGRPLRFDSLSESHFLQARACVDAGRIEEILDMSD